MNNTLIDNSENLRMADKLRELILNPDCKIIKIATGFWDIPGLSLVEKQLREFLSKEGTELRLLIGSDPIVKAYQVNNPILKNSQFPEDYIKRELSVLDVKKDYIDSVRLILDFCQEIESDSKFKIRIYRTNDNGDAQFLHAKCYVFLSEKSCICGIIGSSNFTNKGLTDNAELNYIETASQIVASIPGPYNPNKGHNYWFDEKWNISKPWNKIFLEEVLKPTRVGIEAQKPKPEITPYELYIKYLQTQIGDIANPESKEILKSYLPVGFNAYGYQLDAVLQCFYIMKQHGGFVLSDVVGLGKTVVGTMLIKKFINEAALMGRSSKVLIITPPAIKAAWEQTINDFDKDKTDKILPFINFITTGSIAKILDISEPEENEEFDNDLQYDNYGLILIDESHNFRNKDSQKYKELDNLIQSIEIRVGVTPYIGLLSATPQNNAPKDIYNQILLFQREPNRSTLPNIPGGKLDSFMSEMNREFNELRKDESFKSKARLKEISTEIREKVLNDLVVRRTRHDIKNTYPEDCGTLRFPIVKGPHKLSYKLDSELCQLFYDTIDYIVGDPEKGKKSIPVFNFYPSDEGNKEIKLEQIAYSKLQAFHTMFGEDSKIFSENEELSEAEFLHQYEDELSPLSEYIKDLKDFQSEFPDRYKELALKPFIGIGGSIKLKNSSDSLVVISSEKRGITNVMVSKEYKTSIVAPITAMKFLKCDRNAFFSDTYEDVSKNISDIAISAYNVHVNQMRRAKETKGEIKKAITFLHDLVRPRLTSEGMPSYNKALDALRNASPGVARKILQFQKEYNQFGESLFGMNFDLDIWLNSTFGYLEEQANYQFGTPKIALIESKINKDA